LQIPMTSGAAMSTHANHNMTHHSQAPNPAGATPTEPVAVELLVKQVYEGADNATQSRMLNLLVGKAYDAAPAQVKTSLLEQLMRSVGVLGLVTVAGGVFAKIRLRGGWPDISVRADDLQDIQTADVIALANYVQQVSAHTLIEVAHSLASNPALAGSGAVSVLMGILLHRVPDRRKTPRS